MAAKLDKPMEYSDGDDFTEVDTFIPQTSVANFDEVGESQGMMVGKLDKSVEDSDSSYFDDVDTFIASTSVANLMKLEQGLSATVTPTVPQLFNFSGGTLNNCQISLFCHHVVYYSNVTDFSDPFLSSLHGLPHVPL